MRTISWFRYPYIYENALSITTISEHDNADFNSGLGIVKYNAVGFLMALFRFYQFGKNSKFNPICFIPSLQGV